jgi:SIR2-like domain
MIDPIVSLAFSIYSNKGAYALLLGSGISRPSAIPTGWEVVLDLIRKVARLEGEDCEPDPAAWFKEKHNAEPDYSKLLDVVAKTPTERQQLLRGYFEPSADERKQGLKTPSAAHRAIARLVGAGYVRILVTPNFDRLTEKALEEVGVTPTIISTADQIAGALPLAHSGVTIIKLHGDYLDTRIRNTEAELAGYDPAFDRLLDRIFDEYGLIISGWSAEWDIALRAAIERCPSRRFSTYWAARSPLAGQAKRLADHRRAEILQIRDANYLFETLWEKVRALDDMAAPHPLSAKMAVASVKRYLVDPASKIRLRDLVHEETERLVGELTDKAFPAQTSLHAPDELKLRTGKYNTLCETMLSLLVAGCYWGSQEHSKLWVDCLQRVGTSARSTSGLTYLNKLRRYPALILLYGAGLAAVAAGNYHTFAAILLQPHIKNDSLENEAFCSSVHAWSVMETDVGRLLPGMDRRHTPVSDYLQVNLRSPLRDYIPGDEEYQATFDRFEYLLALVHADLNRWVVQQDGWRGPIGCFGWRGQHFQQSRIMNVIEKEIETEGTNWAPLTAGLFGGSLEQAKTTKSKFDAFLSKIPFF